MFKNNSKRINNLISILYKSNELWKLCKWEKIEFYSNNVLSVE